MKNKKTIIIAEAGVNHNGKINLAKKFECRLWNSSQSLDFTSITIPLENLALVEIPSVGPQRCT